MKWIYGMITDNTYPQFKEEYKKALINNKEEFIWDHKAMRTTFAKYVCILVDKHLLQEYNEHMERYAIQEYDKINY